MEAAWAQVVVSGLVGMAEGALIDIGLKQMRVSSGERNRQLDRQDKSMEQQGRVLENMGLGIQELLKRTA